MELQRDLNIKLKCFTKALSIQIKLLVLEPVYTMGNFGGLEIKFEWHVLYSETQEFSLVTLWLT